MKNSTSPQRAPKYDYLGIFLSALCGVHCLLTPLALVYLPSLGEYVSSPWIHALLIALVAVAFYFSVFTDFKKHKSKLTLILGLAGFALLLGTYFIEVFSHSHHHDHSEEHADETFVLALTLIGALLLMASHWLNIKNCRCLPQKETCK